MSCELHTTHDEVSVPQGTYVLETGALEITEDLTINGAGADATIIDGNGTDGVIVVPNDAIVEISDVAANRLDVFEEFALGRNVKTVLSRGKSAAPLPPHKSCDLMQGGRVAGRLILLK